ncbi:Uncharacterised protein [Edwardsiella tarda]|nr:Uncharacterised protein [Edwardsiella tarda]
MGLTVFGEDLLDHRVQFAVVRFAGTFDHLDAAKRDDGALQRSIGLQTDDLLEIFVDVTGVVRGNGRGDVGIKIDRRMGAVFDFDAFHDFIPQGSGRRGGTGQEGLVAFIRGVVFLDEVTYVDFFLPVTAGKTFPCGCLFFIKFGHLNTYLLVWISL